MPGYCLQLSFYGCLPLLDLCCSIFWSSLRWCKWQCQYGESENWNARTLFGPQIGARGFLHSEFQFSMVLNCHGCLQYSESEKHLPNVDYIWKMFFTFHFFHFSVLRLVPEDSTYINSVSNCPPWFCPWLTTFERCFLSSSSTLYPCGL